jgi:hypothetical protein
MVITIRGDQYWLWRAVDNEGEALDFLVQRRWARRGIWENYVRSCWRGGSLYRKGDVSSSDTFQRFYRAKAMGLDHDFGGSLRTCVRSGAASTDG